jgi:hypothetical protein
MLGPGPGTHNVLRQPDAFQKPDRQVGDVTLPPAMAVRRRTLFGTVVIVPAFCHCLRGRRTSCCGCSHRWRMCEVCERVDAPCNVPDRQGPHDDAPHEHARAQG